MWLVALLQGSEVHGERQAERKEREEPCWERNGGKGNDPVKDAWKHTQHC